MTTTAISMSASGFDHVSAPEAIPRWLGLLARAVAVLAFCVIVAGSFVTSTRSGDADPAWPTFGGSLVPSFEAMWQDTKLFLEHSHRLLAGTLGVVTIVLAICVTAAGRSARRARPLAWAAAATVVVLAVLGGVRVKLPGVHWLPIVHVAVAYPFLAMVSALACVLGRRWGATAGILASPGIAYSLPDAAWVSNGALATMLLVYTQAVLGAVPRHLYDGAMYHIVGAFTVSTVILLVASRVLGRHGKLQALLRPSAALLVLTVVQFFLGFTSYVTRPEGRKLDGSELFEVVASLHQMAGALMVAAAAVLLVRSWQHLRLVRARVGVAPSPTGGPS